MNLLRSIFLVTAAGLVGLVLIYTDHIPIPLGWARIAFGFAFYAGVGYVLARWNALRHPLVWALVAGWGPGILGLVGLSEALFEPARGDPVLASLFLLGPALSALSGGRLATRRPREGEAGLDQPF